MDSSFPSRSSVHVPWINRFFPSSYKSEAMGILTALLTLPYNSTCTISTDSANCIQSSNVPKAHEFTHAQPTSQLKQNSFLIWNLIFWLIHHRNIVLVLKKVKAHEVDTYNNRADELALPGTYLEDLIIVNHNFFHPLLWVSLTETIYT